MNGAQDITFHSRIDAWLAGIVLFALGLQLVLAIQAYAVSPAAVLPYIGVVVFMVVLGWLVGYPCDYTLTDDHLVIRSGIVRYRVPYAGITSIEPSASLWAAPALSLRRVKITGAGRFYLVSPNDRDRFIEMLRERVAASGAKSRAASTAR
jgi:uncharacterized membrane protein YdbT with pleckstrin-like domain